MPSTLKQVVVHKQMCRQEQARQRNSGIHEIYQEVVPASWHVPYWEWLLHIFYIELCQPYMLADCMYKWLFDSLSVILDMNITTRVLTLSYYLTLHCG